MPPRKKKPFCTYDFQTDAAFRKVEIFHDGEYEFYATFMGTQYRDVALDKLKYKLSVAGKLADKLKLKLYLFVHFIERGRGDSRTQAFLGFSYHVEYRSETIHDSSGPYCIAKHAHKNLDGSYEDAEPDDPGERRYIERRGDSFGRGQNQIVEWTAEREAVLHASAEALYEMRQKLYAVFSGTSEEVAARLDAAPTMLALPAKTGASEAKLQVSERVLDRGDEGREGYKDHDALDAEDADANFR